MVRLSGKIVMALMILSLAGACGIKKETHQRVLDELMNTQSNLEKTQKERDKLKAANNELEGNLDSTRGDSARSAKQAAEIIAKLGGDVKRFEQELKLLRAQQARAEKRLAAFRRLQDRFRKLVDTGKLSVAFRNGQMVLKLPSGVLFPSGKAKLSNAGQTALAEILGILMEFKDRRFMVAGHTDNVPIKTRRFKNNWQLSTARAVSVLEFMLASGFDGKNVSAAGFGEFDPVAGNDSAENKQLNRRIEIILVPDLSELPNLTSAAP